MSTIFENALWLLPGVLTGILTMLMLRWTIQALRPSPDGSLWPRVWAGYLLRLVVVAGFLTWVALKGVGPLLWAFAGVMASRWAMVLLRARWFPDPTKER